MMSISENLKYRLIHWRYNAVIYYSVSTFKATISLSADAFSSVCLWLTDHVPGYRLKRFFLSAGAWANSIAWRFCGPTWPLIGSGWKRKF